MGYKSPAENLNKNIWIIKEHPRLLWGYHFSDLHVSDIKQPNILYENNDAKSNKNSTYLNGIYEENSECEQSESLDFS